MLALPIANYLSTPENRPEYRRWLRDTGADRVFLIECSLMGYPYIAPDDVMARLKENIDYYRTPTEGDDGYEVGVWVNGLGHGGELSGDPADATAAMTKICDLETGASVSDSFCPLDPVFRETYLRNIRRVAVTRPDLIQIDDDYRLACHGPVAIGCACERHMALYNQRARAAGIADRDVTREELASFVLRGKPTPHRRVWLDLMGETLCDFARDLRAAVDEVDPAIRLGACACLSTWDLDGTDCITLARIFAGRTKPFLRLIGAPYWTVIHGFHTTGAGSVTDLIRMQVAWCREQAPDVEIFAEGDCFPRPRYNVPAALVETYHQVLTADGFPHILKYIFDYGYEPAYETGYLRLHVGEAEKRQAITAATADTVGAGIYVFEPMHKVADTDATGLARFDLFERFTTAAINFVSRMGLPASYKRTAYTPVTLCFGESARHIPLDRLDSDLILDAPAAAILLERGVELGLAAVTPMDKPAAETVTLPGTPSRRFPVDTNGRFWRLTPSGDAAVLGTYDTGAPAFLTATRADGRTVSVYAFDMESVSFDSAYMKNDCRRDQLLTAIGHRLPALPEEPRLYIIARKHADKTAVFIWNFSRDIALPHTVHLDDTYTTITPLSNTRAILTPAGVVLEEPLYPYGFAGFVVRK